MALDPSLIIGPTGTPPSWWTDTAYGRVHASYDTTYRRAFAGWGEGVPTITGAFSVYEGGVAPTAVRLTVDGAEYRGHLGATEHKTSLLTALTDVVKPATWLSRDAHQIGLWVAGRVWKVRTTRFATFSFRRDGIELATLKSGVMTFPHSPTPSITPQSCRFDAGRPTPK